MKKVILLIIVCLGFWTTSVQAQSITPNVSPSSGGYYTNGATSISWTMGETFTTTLQNGSTLVTQGEQQPEVDLLTGTPASVVICVGSSIAIPYTAKGYYGPANVFTAQLSDAAGSFAAALSIGNINAQTSGSIIAAIPPGTAVGTGYRVRVVSSLPAYTGMDNGTNITLTTAPTAGITNNTGTTLLSCTTSSISLSATGGGAYLWDNGSTADTRTVTAAGTYTVTVSGSGGCSATAGITITAASGGISPIITGITTVCVNGTFYLIATAPGAYSYVWSGPGGFYAFGPTITRRRATLAMSGTYTVTATGAGGCSGTASVVVTVVSCKTEQATETLTAYPNPFTESSTLAFTLPETTEATLKVYSAEGKEVAQLFKGTAEAGQLYSIEFDGVALPSGVYIASLTGQSGVQIRYRLLLAK